VTLGSVIRRALGPRLARYAGRSYRNIFVDLRKMAFSIAEVIPPDAHLLDVGGGDGQPLNQLLSLRPDLRITTIDPAPVVGQWIESQYRGNVMCLPRTTLAGYLAGGPTNPDVILIADVLHHIPESARDIFVRTLRVACERKPNLKIIVKDVEPGHWRASLGFWSDRYITGDENVRLISSDSATSLFEAGLGPLRRFDTDLFRVDKPNYAIVLQR
jgi:2-polyprenyl-3-methyl-5-hydroxy-6-metoxy-1,4-benzoquinol methylase